jgi:large subunit ribosomal protein L23
VKDPYLVLKKLLRTEKGTTLQARENKYFFHVDLDATKLDVRSAVEKVYKVKVTKVNTQVVSGKPKTVRQAAGRRPDWKKAIVTLAEGQAIELKA